MLRQPSDSCLWTENFNKTWQLSFSEAVESEQIGTKCNQGSSKYCSCHKTRAGRSLDQLRRGAVSQTSQGSVIIIERELPRYRR